MNSLLVTLFCSFMYHSALSLKVENPISQDNTSNVNLDNFNYGVITSLKQCLQMKNKFDCLKRKVIQKLDDEMQRNRTININDSIYIKRDSKWDAENNIPNGQRSLSLSNWKSKGTSNTSLNEILIEKVNEYVKSIVIQFKLDGGSDEARKRKGGKGQHSMLMVGALGMASILGQVFMGKLALAAGAALIIAKISLLLALLSSISKKSSGSETEHIVYAGGDHGSHHGGWQRSSAAQEKAYRAHAVKYARPGMESPMMQNMGYAIYDESSKGDMEN